MDDREQNAREQLDELRKRADERRAKLEAEWKREHGHVWTECHALDCPAPKDRELSEEDKLFRQWMMEQQFKTSAWRGEKESDDD